MSKCSVLSVLVLAVVAGCGATSSSSSEPRPVTSPADPASTPVAAGPICGTRGAAECAAPMFCNFQPGAQCGMADAPGRCEPRPEMCAEIYKPVCGCDGKTYGNECAAGAAGTGVMAEGECPATTP